MPACFSALRLKSWAKKKLIFRNETISIARLIKLA